MDASAAVELVRDAAGAAVARRLRSETVHVPAHFDVEVIGAIRRAVVRRLISDHEGLVAAADFRSLSLRRWPIMPFVQRAYQLRNTHGGRCGVRCPRRGPHGTADHLRRATGSIPRP